MLALATKPAAVALAVFLLLEMTARLYLFGSNGIVPERVNSVHALSETGFTRPSSTPGLGFEFTPNVSGWFKLVPFRTNSLGMRDAEYPRKKPEGTLRIAVVGASFALPAGVAIERAFHSLLEDRLSRELAPLRVECLNFAVGMYHPRQSLAMLERRALGFEPDLILFSTTRISTAMLLANPRQEAPSTAAMGGDVFTLQFRKSYPFLRSFLLRLMRARFSPDAAVPQPDLGFAESLYMRLSESLQSPARAPSVPRSRGVDGSLRPEREPVIDRLAQVGRRTGIPIVITRLEFDPSPPSPTDVALSSRAAELGLHLVDTRQAFEGTSPRDFWIYELDPHPDWRAHELFAASIASFLRSNELDVRHDALHAE